MMFAPALRAKRAVAAILAAALPLLTIAAACSTPEPQIIEREIIVREVVKEVEVVVTATPAPQPTATPMPTAAPSATPKPAPTPTPVPISKETEKTVEKPTPIPVRVSTIPVATPTPPVNDYYVIINQGRRSDGHGIAVVYDKARHIESGNGDENHFGNEDFFINYLLSQGVITPAQRSAYYTPVTPERENDFVNLKMAKFFDEKYAGNIKVPLQPFADAVSKLSIAQQEETIGKRVVSYLIRHYVDENSLRSDAPISSGDNTISVPSEDEGYVIINGNNVQTVMVDSQGNTTSVDVKIAGIEEVLDYWLSQNKITVEQHNQYGQTGKLELSFKDGADLFDFAYSDGAFHAGIDEEGASIIRDKLLPLFTGQ